MKRIILIMIGLSVVVLAAFVRDDSTGIVTDTTTGLNWQDNETVSKSWIQAIDYCEALTLGGYDDWRLPNQNELRSIVDRSKKNPAIDNSFKTIDISNSYWSSTTVYEYNNLAWLVSFSIGYGNKNSKSYEFNVRCVRDGQ